MQCLYYTFCKILCGLNLLTCICNIFNFLPKNFWRDCGLKTGRISWFLISQNSFLYILRVISSQNKYFNYKYTRNNSKTPSIASMKNPQLLPANLYLDYFINTLLTSIFSCAPGATSSFSPSCWISASQRFRQWAISIDTSNSAEFRFVHFIFRFLYLFLADRISYFISKYPHPKFKKEKE